MGLAKHCRKTPKDCASIPTLDAQDKRKITLKHFKEKPGKRKVIKAKDSKIPKSHRSLCTYISLGFEAQAMPNNMEPRAQDAATSGVYAAVHYFLHTKVAKRRRTICFAAAT